MNTYLRFFSGSGHQGVTGEVTLKPGESKRLAVSPTRDLTLKVIRGVIAYLPFWYDSKMYPGEEVLNVDYLSPEKISVKPLREGLTMSLERIKGIRRRVFSETVKMKLGETYEVPVSERRTTNGVIIPYNNFSVQQISALDDERVSEANKARLRELETLF